MTIVFSSSFSECSLSLLDKSRPLFMTAITDLLVSNIISRNSVTDALTRSECSPLLYEFGTVRNNGKWEGFGSDVFDIQQNGNNYKLGVSSTALDIICEHLKIPLSTTISIATFSRFRNKEISEIQILPVRNWRVDCICFDFILFHINLISVDS